MVEICPYISGKVVNGLQWLCFQQVRVECRREIRQNMTPLGVTAAYANIS